jgi:hypothetical protein
MMVLLEMTKIVKIIEVFDNYPLNNIEIYGILKIGICRPGFILFVLSVNKLERI